MFRWILSAKLAGAPPSPSHITRTKRFWSIITYRSTDLDKPVDWLLQPASYYSQSVFQCLILAWYSITVVPSMYWNHLWFTLVPFVICHRSVLRAQAPFKIKMLNPYAITPSHQEKILAKLWNQNNRDFHFVLAFSPFHCHKEIILEKSMYKKFAHIYFMNCLFSVVICLWNIIYWLELVANICYFLFSNSFICECGWYVQSQK